MKIRPVIHNPAPIIMENPTIVVTVRLAASLSLAPSCLLARTPAPAAQIFSIETIRSILCSVLCLYFGIIPKDVICDFRKISRQKPADIQSFWTAFVSDKAEYFILSMAVSPAAGLFTGKCCSAGDFPDRIVQSRTARRMTGFVDYRSA